MAHLSDKYKSVPTLLPLHLTVDTEMLEREVALLVATHGKGEAKFQYGEPDPVPWWNLMLQSCDGGLTDNHGDNGNLGCLHRPTKVLRDPQARYLSSLLSPLGDRLFRARLSMLPPGCFGWYHNDPGKWQKVARVHIPITRPTAGYSFLHGGRLVELPVGSVVVGDFNIPHTLWNLGNVTRTTLLMDIDLSRPELLRGTALGDAVLEHKDKYRMTEKRERLHNITRNLFVKYRVTSLAERKAAENRRAAHLAGSEKGDISRMSLAERRAAENREAASLLASEKKGISRKERLIASIGSRSKHLALKHS